MSLFRCIIAACGPDYKGWYQFVNAGAARFLPLEDWEYRLYFVCVIVIDIMNIIIDLSGQLEIAISTPGHNEHREIMGADTVLTNSD